MFLASKIALGYIGYLSIKNKNKKNLSNNETNKTNETNENIENNKDYDTKIDKILQKKKENNELKIHKKQKIDNFIVNRNIKTKEECDKIFQKFIKNNVPNITPIMKPKLFTYEVKYNNILLNYENNYIYFDLHLQENKKYKLYIEFEISDVNHIDFLMTNNNTHIDIQFENIFKNNKVKIIMNYLCNLKDVTLYILFKRLYKSTNIKNIYFYINELKEINVLNDNYPLIIYKNNDIIKQIFYETKNIFFLNKFLIREPYH